MIIQLTANQARIVYGVLVEFCGMTMNMHHEEMFVQAVTRKHDHNIEYRFQGSLGFGGKFHADRNQWRVSYYTEDDTTARRIMKSNANHVLNALYAALGTKETEVQP